MPKQHTLSAADIAYCKKIHKKHGKHYYFASYFFPKELRQATYVLYAFFRVPDEFVDNPENADTNVMTKKLEQWKRQWRECYHGQNCSDPVLRATREVFLRYGIPYEYSEAFLQAMIQDITVGRYETYKNLEYYMYGSAGVVGIIMSYIIGFTDQRALEYAKKLGYAMQLTNFLRDIQEDSAERNRIYMPLDELARFGLTTEDIIQNRMSQDMQNFLQYQTDRINELYTEAEEGIALLDEQGQFPVLLASRLYQKIAIKLEKKSFPIFEEKISTNFLEKCVIFWQTRTYTRT